MAHSKLTPQQSKNQQRSKKTISQQLNNQRYDKRHSSNNRHQTTNNSLVSYIFFRIAIAALSFTAHAVIGGAFAAWYVGIQLPLLFNLWAIAEALFYCWFIWARHAAQKRTTDPHTLTRPQRLDLVERVMRTMPCPNIWLQNWFGVEATEVGFDDVANFWLSTLCHTSIEREMINEKNTGRNSEFLEEAYSYTRFLEQTWGFPFKQGSNPAAQQLRLSEDPVLSDHRPLLWYMIIGVLDLIVHVQLRHLNFHHRKASSPYNPVFPVSISHFSHPSDSKLSYWYKPPKFNNLAHIVDPIVIIHGIGVGLYSFLPMIERLSRDYPDVPIFCVENSHVGMRVVRAVPTNNEVCDGIKSMLHGEGYQRAVFMGHSLGTASLAFLLHNAATRPLISGLIFLDPITFLLHQADVAYNFVYRKPKSANEWMVHYFAAREIGVSWYILRYFYWYHKIVWKDEIDTVPTSVETSRSTIIVSNEEEVPTRELWRGRTLVVLSGEDQLVPAYDVWNYLTDKAPIEKIPSNYNDKDNKKNRWSQVKAAIRSKLVSVEDDSWDTRIHDGVEVVFYPYIDHGAVLFSRRIEVGLCAKIATYCRYSENNIWMQ